MTTTGTVTVYRVENAEGAGPYKGYGTYHAIHDTDAYCLPQHPTPDSDGLQDARRLKRNFGFAERRQFERWFELNARKRLTERGYHLAVYEVPADAVDHGFNQLVFDRQRALARTVEPLL